jgi:ribosome biogenesis protein Nip4
MHDICASFSPDLLHMVLKPLKDYIIDWIEEELDQMDKEDQGSRSLTFTRRYVKFSLARSPSVTDSMISQPPAPVSLP